MYLRCIFCTFCAFGQLLHASVSNDERRNHILNKRSYALKNSSLPSDTADVVDRVLRLLMERYGKDGRMTIENLNSLLQNIEIGNAHHDEHEEMEEVHPTDDSTEGEDHSDALNQCLNASDIGQLHQLNSQELLSANDFKHICPTLIYQLDVKACKHEHHVLGHNDTKTNHSWPSAQAWGYSIIACILISLVGLVAVAIIPIMHKVIYNHMLQFLVALAIGSLTGDALLHLIPHAISPHVHSHDGHTDDHDKKPVWLGLTALSGIFLFFVVERLVGMCSERKRHQNESKLQPDKKSSSAPSIYTSPKLLPNPDESKTVGARLSRQNGNSTSCEEMLMTVHTSKEVKKLAKDARDEVHKNCDPDTKDLSWGPNESSRGHHHSHDLPGSVASVAWMVIVGDGFHNFADGIAIGSAFANSLQDGLSTSIAVFCHELPHELGDFAMLLNAGMSAKQALVYNCVSSLFCMLGMVVGVGIGNVAAASPWIFSLVAGLFLYIALVDMLPEMKTVVPKKGEHPFLHLGLQMFGMLTGATIMLMIALFEDRIDVFGDR